MPTVVQGMDRIFFHGRGLWRRRAPHTLVCRERALEPSRFASAEARQVTVICSSRPAAVGVVLHAICGAARRGGGRQPNSTTAPRVSRAPLDTIMLSLHCNSLLLLLLLLLVDKNSAAVVYALWRRTRIGRGGEPVCLSTGSLHESIMMDAGRG
jgi:hypothetical protein